MNAKKIAFSGSVAGVLILILMVVINVMVNMVIPADISRYGGMRVADDPVMILFFFYPFVVAFAAAIIFDASSTSDIVRSGPPVMLYNTPRAPSIDISRRGDAVACLAAR